MRPQAYFVVFLMLAGSLWANDSCLRCHGGQPPAGQQQAATVNMGQLEGSIHGALGCTDCHQIDPSRSHVGAAAQVACSSCHEDAAQGFNQSPHISGRQQNIDGLPTCVTCHGGHDILAVADPNSKTFHRNSVQICITCHEDQQLKDRVDAIPSPLMIKAYENSVHGRALIIDGNDEAPACVDCHGSHSTMPSDNPDSPVYKTHVAATCGNCHSEIAEHFNASVHGTGLAIGALESPTCTNCHGEHDIRPHLDPSSKVYSLNVAKTCSDCHTSEVIVGKFGLKADRIDTFKESFHGVAIELGQTKAANCASCHGVHDIYPQSDERSMIHPANIQATCGHCHEGLPADFARGTFHESASEKESGGEFYVRQFYIWFITILVIGFILYRILEYKRRVKRVE